MSEDLNDEMAQASTALFTQHGIDAVRAKVHTGQPSSAVCEGCGAPISPERQKAVPGVTLCAGCKEVQERLNRHFSGTRGGYHA